MLRTINFIFTEFKIKFDKSEFILPLDGFEILLDQLWPLFITPCNANIHLTINKHTYIIGRVLKSFFFIFFMEILIHSIILKKIFKE